MNEPEKTSPEKIYLAAIEALNRSQWRHAQDLVAQLMRSAPQHAGVYFIAGVAASRQNQVDLALAYLQRAVALNPRRPDYAAELARIYMSGWFMREALETADRAFKLAPSDPMTLDTLGVVYSRANAHERAAEVFALAAQKVPQSADYRFNWATALTATGDLDGAEREYLECLRLNPRFWKAYLALSQSRKQTTEHNHVPMLNEHLANVGDNDEAAMYLNLSLAKEHEDTNQYAEAFSYLSEGKRRGGRRRNYTSARDERLFEGLIQALTAPVQDAAGHDSREPIFVVGMPRSGTTLVERILSSHPQVLSAGELQNFGVALKRASGSSSPPLLDIDTIQRARGVDWKQLGARYIDGTRPLTGARAHFVDKLPHNFLYAGYIARALPKAGIICLRRDPMDTCLSNFRQLFAQTTPYYDYSFDLLDTGRYYLLFDKLMAHWEATMHGRILQVEYESLVDNQERETRRIVAHCGLEWDDACLRFEENEAPVSTASAVQVRSPMFRSSMQRWKRYEAQLGPLRALLEDHGVRLT